jgi:hypothetical protein
MDILDFKDLEDWLFKNECYPFEDSLGNLCISVESEHESFGGEKDARLEDAKQYGIDRLIRFYGKTYISEPLSTPLSTPLSQIDVSDIEFTLFQTSIDPTTPTKLYDAASTPDYFISSRACVRMKVLVKIPKDTFDDHTANLTACDIIKPAEGYLSAFISENYERDIDYVTNSMEDFLPKMAKSDKYITNINIVKEIGRLKQVKNIIRRYFNLNSVVQGAHVANLSDSGGASLEDCEVDNQSQMEIGFGYDYKPAFALIDGNKYTIGYDCFLEASLLNHPTTANYLIQLGNMSSALTEQRSLNFDIFQFLSQHTYPTPVIEAKKNYLDGLEKYDDNGNLFSFANLAKLITLDLDSKSCKSDEEIEKENNIIWDEQTSRNIADTARQSREFVGNIKFSTKGFQDLKKTGISMFDAAKEPEEALRKIITDVYDSVNWGCVIEETLQCMLEEAITEFGTKVFDDPDLGKFFSADGTVELLGLCEPKGDCGDELPIQLKVGLPAFQGITVPQNFPTTDYLSKTMNSALKQFYNIMINSLVSLLLGILDNMCKASPQLSDLPSGETPFGEGFTACLSETMGIDLSKLGDMDSWADAVTSAGGAGFMSVVANLSSTAAGSWNAFKSDTGVSINFPNPETGLVEGIFISPELIFQTMSGIRKATEDLEVVLTPEELRALYKGAAPDDVLELAFGCLSRDNSSLFKSREGVSDLFSSLGEMSKCNLLEPPATLSTVVTNACELGDGSDQDVLRKNFLTTKDPLLSDSEVEELISREKIRFVEKTKKTYKLLKSFQDKSAFPEFPSLFGSDDSLIPEAPPIISTAMAAASEGLYASTISNFNFAMLSYAPLWKSKQMWHEYETINTFSSLSRMLMKQALPNTEALALNLLVDDNITTLGYNIHDNTADKIFGTLILIESSEPKAPKIIQWDGGTADAFDAGKYTDDWWKNNSGPDDGRFRELIEYAGIRHVDLSEDDFALFGIDSIKWWIAAAALVVLIIFTAGATAGVASAAAGYTSALATVPAITGSVVVAEAFAAVTLAGTVGIFGLAAISVPTLQIITAIAVGAFLILGTISAASAAFDWASKDSNQATYLYLSTLVQENSDIDWVMEQIDCAYNSGYLTKSDYDSLLPVANEIVTSLSQSADGIQWEFIKSIGNYLEEIDDSNDTYSRTFDISSFLEVKKDNIKTELILASEATGTNLFFDGKATMSTIATLRETPYDQEEVTIDRAKNFSEVITSFERRGVRSAASSANEGSMTLPVNTNLVAIYDSGTELAEYDRIDTQISNYRIENGSSLLLGRKIAQPGLLETRYSSTIDAPNMPIMELYGLQRESNSDLQEYHSRLKEIFKESGIVDPTDDDLKSVYETTWNSCIRRMAERVSNNRLYLDEYLNALDFEYPKQDIFGYKKVSKESIDLTSSIMKLESSNEDYCDTLTPLRRSGAITGIRLLIRAFIVERVVNSIQVFDTFNTGFMTSDMFKKAVFDDIKVEMKKYQNSFSQTLDGKIFSDIKETASKYFEIQRLLGNEVPELNTDKEAILEIIKMEADDMSTTIASQLKLDILYQSTSWDEFVFDVLLTAGTYASGFDINNDNKLREETYLSALYPFYVKEYHEENNGIYTYVAELLYSNTTTVVFGQEHGVQISIVRAECEGEKPVETVNGCNSVQTVANYSTVKQLLFDSEIYQDVVSYVFPLKDVATLLSTYHLSAITDPVVFSATYGGKHVTDLFSETKLSTLQAFLVCLHGAGETTYIDPFLEKLKT